MLGSSLETCVGLFGYLFQIILANKGDIDAGFEYVATETLFGKQFIFIPDCGVVKAGDYQAIQVNICLRFS